MERHTLSVFIEASSVSPMAHTCLLISSISTWLTVVSKPFSQFFFMLEKEDKRSHFLNNLLIFLISQVLSALYAENFASDEGLS